MSDMSGFGFGSRDPTHWTNGGTGVTNFTEDMRPVYVEAVKRYGDKRLRVHAKSFGKGNQNYGGSLHNHGERKDLSDFWDIFDKVRTEMGKDIKW